MAEAEAAAGRPLARAVFVDKLPLNIFEVGLINVLFPEARLIVALRDPRDSCLSCFMQEFGLNTAMVNFLDWERTAEFYAATMGFWLEMRRRITLECLEVRYEDTVADLEAQARQLLAFLGVEWDDRVLRYDEQARRKLISTPSAAAVARPIYRGALERWRRHEQQVRRVAGRLQPFIEAFGYA